MGCCLLRACPTLVASPPAIPATFAVLSVVLPPDVTPCVVRISDDDPVDLHQHSWRHGVRLGIDRQGEASCRVRRLARRGVLPGSHRLRGSCALLSCCRCSCWRAGRLTSVERQCGQHNAHSPDAPGTFFATFFGTLFAAAPDPDGMDAVVAAGGRCWSHVRASGSQPECAAQVR